MDIKTTQKSHSAITNDKTELAKQKALDEETSREEKISALDQALQLSYAAYIDAQATESYLASSGFTHYQRVARWFGAEGFCCIRNRRAYLSFCGTESIADIIVDIVGLLPWYKPRVHAGFGVSWYGLKRKAMADWLAANSREFDDISLYGHSLGGAMAHVAALDIADSYTIREVITFGAPRSSFGSTAQLYDSTVSVNSTHALKDITTRVVHGFDIVSKVPFEWMAYQHVGHLVYIDYKANFHFGKKAIETKESESILGVIDQFLTAFTGNQRSKKVQKKPRKASKMSIMDHIGTAIHLANMVFPFVHGLLLAIAALLIPIPAFLVAVVYIVVSSLSHPTKSYFAYFPGNSILSELKPTPATGLVGIVKKALSGFFKALKIALAFATLAGTIYVVYLIAVHWLIPGLASIPSWFSSPSTMLQNI